MTATLSRTVLGLALLAAACSNEFQVFEPRPDIEVPPVPNDAGNDAGVDAEAATPDATAVDARIQEDAMPTLPDGAVSPSLVSGFAQTCALREGQLYCWGADYAGQAGVVGNRPVTRPTKVNQDTYTDLCTGETHSCALRTDGTVLCWGNNEYGQLGVGDLNPRELPAAIPGREFDAIACGGDHTCGLAARGELWCWGQNVDGQLGQSDPPAGAPGTLPFSPTPVEVQTALRFAKVRAGQGHVCAVDAQGKLYCWGRNNHDQLGIVGAPEGTRAPQPVSGNGQYRSLSTGQHHTCAVDMADHLWCWGQTLEGLLGVSSDQPKLAMPTRVDGDDFDSVSINWLHSCALKKNGTALCWGRGIEGQLGNGSTGPRDRPTPIFGDRRFLSINAGQFHTCGFTADGLYCWGANDAGQLGLGILDERRYVPSKVEY